MHNLSTLIMWVAIYDGLLDTKLESVYLKKLRSIIISTAVSTSYSVHQ